MGPEFFQTQMGRKFYESSVPRLVKALERIVEALEGQKEIVEVKSKEADDTRNKYHILAMEIIKERGFVVVDYQAYQSISEYLILHEASFRVVPQDEELIEIHMIRD
jgi:hypothetical protein